MSGFQKQLEAIGSALLLIEKLPDGTVWSLTCTNDDDAESPSVLNIFIPEALWVSTRERLKFGQPLDRSTHDGAEQFMSFRRGTLYISFIDQENA